MNKVCPNRAGGGVSPLLSGTQQGAYAPARRLLDSCETMERYGVITSQVQPERMILPFPAAVSRQRRYDRCKVALDFAAAVVLLVLSAPVMLLAALLIKLTSRGPVLYTQIRVGYRGRTFTIYKLRTMYDGCEKLSGPCWAVPGDPRITPIGRLLRATHLDELPQLFNILRGEMSLIGPRPERIEFVAELERLLPFYRRRSTVRPGITGLAQVQLDPDTTLANVHRKLAYDLHYVAHRGPWLDFRILLCTVCFMLGVPFALTGPLFGIPRGRAVEGPPLCPPPAQARRKAA